MIKLDVEDEEPQPTAKIPIIVNKKNPSLKMTKDSSFEKNRK